MQLAVMPDMNLNLSEFFGIQIKNHKCYFRVKNEKHAFGSKLYPVGKRTELFLPHSVEPSTEYDEIAQLIQNSGWVPTNGGCYSHAELLHTAFKARGIPARYFSGWVFTSGGFPIHHAWVVVDGYVYDIAVNTTTLNYMRQLEAEGKNPREMEYVRRVKEMEDNWQPIQEHFTWGNAQMIYIGAESDPIAARRQYNAAIDHAGDIGEHPSYRHMKKKSRYDASPYQKALNDIGGRLGAENNKKIGGRLHR